MDIYINKEFLTLEAFIGNRGNSLPCRAKCPDCGIKWKDSQTAFVNLVASLKDGKRQSRYICDGCARKINKKA